jgi:hypothetical protein
MGGLKSQLLCFPSYFNLKENRNLHPFAENLQKDLHSYPLCYCFIWFVTAASFKTNSTPSRVVLADKVTHNFIVTYSIGFTTGTGLDAGLHSLKQSTMDNPKSCRYAYNSLLPWRQRLQFLLKHWLTSYKTVWCHPKRQ